MGHEAGQSRIRSPLAMAGLGADQRHNMGRMGAVRAIDKGVTPSYVSENPAVLSFVRQQLHASSKHYINPDGTRTCSQPRHMTIESGRELLD